MAAIFSDHPLAMDDLSSKELLEKENPMEHETHETGEIEKRANPTFWQWMFQKPLSKLPFIYFVVGIIGVFGLSEWHFIEPDTSYILCGSCYIVLCLFAVKHFGALMNLKQQVTDFHKMNRKLMSEHHKISFEVHRLTHANNNLAEARHRILVANAQNRANLIQFHSIQDTMKSMNIAQVDELIELTNGVGKRWKEQLTERERDMLHTVFDRFEFKSGKDGMTRKEFEEFSLELPVSYQQRFARLGTFRQVSTDGDTIQFSDFDAALDIFAEMEALDVDIEFSIEKKHSITSDKLSRKIELSRARTRKSTLKIIVTDDSEDIPRMKQWKSKRKVYDDFNREIVVHSKTFRSRKLKDFTACLGLADASQSELHSPYK